VDSILPLPYNARATENPRGEKLMPNRATKPSILILLAILLVSSAAVAVTRATPQARRQQFQSVTDPVIAITHAIVIDGTGAAPLADQTILIDHGKITTVGSSASTPAPAGTKIIDASGKTVIPGLVGMHEHLFYLGPGENLIAIHPMYSFPQLYLASGVTTARTAGSVDPYGDIQIKALVDRGELPGPHLHLTTPYLQGAPTLFVQMHELKDAAEAREFVRYWHSVGFTSVKAYADITPDELRAGIDEAHKLGMTITGHLCSVGYRDAAEMGIDNLEHGPFVAPDGELDPDHVPNGCQTDLFGVMGRIVTKVDPDGPEIKQTLKTLLDHHVAVTSTLAVIDAGFAANQPMFRRTQELLNPMSWSHTMTTENASAQVIGPLFGTMMKKEVKFEQEFVAAGGLLMAGCDPTGDGHTLAGLGDQRNVELLVAGGFSIPDAVKIATLNGATFLHEASRIGSIAAGKNADLILLDGDMSKDVNVIERPVAVFKDGVGYDSAKIYESLRGTVGFE
jgi:Amidohydrolase family